MAGVSELTPVALLLYRNAPLEKTEFSLSVSFTQCTTTAVCAFLVRYLRWLYFGTFSLLSAAASNPRKWHHLQKDSYWCWKGLQVTRHHAGQQDRGDFEETQSMDIVEGTHALWSGPNSWPCVHSAFAEVVGKALYKYLAPSGVSPLEVFVVWCGRGFFYTRQTEEPLPS